MPSLLHSRGALAGVGSAASLIAAAVVSLLFGAGLVAFSEWPSTSGTGVPSVSLPSAPARAVPAGARGRAVAAVPTGAVVIPAAAAAPRARSRTVARPLTRTGSSATPSSTPVVAAAPPPTAAPAPAGGTAPPSAGVTGRLAHGLADTTTSVTSQAAGAVGGPAGAAVQSTGQQVAQTLDNVGAAADALLGG